MTVRELVELAIDRSDADLEVMVEVSQDLWVSIKSLLVMDTEDDSVLLLQPDRELTIKRVRKPGGGYKYLKGQMELFSGPDAVRPEASTGENIGP